MATPKIVCTDPEGASGYFVTADGRTFYGPLPPQAADLREVYDAMIARGVVPQPFEPPDQVVPDQPTLADWRVGLLLWQRLDEVGARVAGLIASTQPAERILGAIAHQQLEYSNNVSRARLTQIRAAFGFSEAEVDESLWRADRVARGDLSGVWPLPAA